MQPDKATQKENVMATPEAPTQDPAIPLAQELGVQPPEPQQPAQVEPESGEDLDAAAVNSDLDDVEKQVETRVWKFSGEFIIDRNGVPTPQQFEGEYEQKPLSYFAFLEFTGLIAKKIDEAMSGPDGLTIQTIVDSTEGAMPFLVDGKNVSSVIEKKDFNGLDAFVQGLFKLASYVPDLIEDCQFTWLRVPRRDRPFLREIWGRSPSDGGMTNDEGEEMLTVFIDQNYEELEDFFVERLPRIVKTTQAARKRMMKGRAELPEGSRRSRPWRATQEITQSQ